MIAIIIGTVLGTLIAFWSWEAWRSWRRNKVLRDREADPRASPRPGGDENKPRT